MLRAGIISGSCVKALDNYVTDAMIGLGDMPLLPSTLLDSLIQRILVVRGMRAILQYCVEGDAVIRCCKTFFRINLDRWTTIVE